MSAVTLQLDPILMARLHHQDPILMARLRHQMEKVRLVVGVGSKVGCVCARNYYSCKANDGGEPITYFGFRQIGLTQESTQLVLIRTAGQARWECAVQACMVVAAMLVVAEVVVDHRQTSLWRLLWHQRMSR